MTGQGCHISNYCSRVRLKGACSKTFEVSSRELMSLSQLFSPQTGEKKCLAVKFSLVVISYKYM